MYEKTKEKHADRVVMGTHTITATKLPPEEWA
jgi:hypothetical protein